MATEYKLSYTAQEIDEKLGMVDNAVLYTPQTLTEERQAQARENIGAIGVDALYTDNQIAVAPVKTYADSALYVVPSQGRLYYRASVYSNVAVYQLFAGEKYTFDGTSLISLYETYALADTLFEKPASGYGAGVVYTDFKTETADGTHHYEITPTADCYLYVQTGISIDQNTNMKRIDTVSVMDVLEQKAEKNRIAYKVDTENGILLSTKYDKDSDIQHLLCRHSLNNLFDFLHTYIFDNADAVPEIHELNDSNRVIYGSGDWHAPFQIKAVNNIDGDYTDGAYFTGGAHGYKNATTNASATARCAGVKYYADGRECASGETGLADEVAIYWENFVQASNTIKEDGTGREVLRECHTLTYRNGVFYSHTELIPIEDISVVLWYGLQMLYQSGTNKSLYYVGAINRAANACNAASESGDNSCNLIRLVNNETGLVQELYLDTNSDLGKRFMCNEGLTKAMFGANYGKAYCTVANNNGTMLADCLYVLDGEYRVYKEKTI